MCQEHLKLHVTISDIDRSHRIGAKPAAAAAATPASDVNGAGAAPPAETNGTAGDAAPDPTQKAKPRVLMVKFVSYQTRSRVFANKRNLKTHNRQNPGEAIFINEDLTKRKAELCFKARSKKQAHPDLIQDVWSYDGRILIKDRRGVVRHIKSESDLDQYCNVTS